MQEKGIATPWGDELWMAERAIVLQVLRLDRDPRWSLAELRGKIDDLDPEVLAQALESLYWHRVVETCLHDYVASRCALHLDALGLVSI